MIRTSRLMVPFSKNICMRGHEPGGASMNVQPGSAFLYQAIITESRSGVSCDTRFSGTWSAGAIGSRLYLPGKAFGYLGMDLQASQWETLLWLGALLASAGAARKVVAIASADARSVVRTGEDDLMRTSIVAHPGF